MNLIVVKYEHRFGVDTYLFRTPLTPREFPSEKAVAKILQLDFDPDQGETLEFTMIEETEIEEYDHRWRRIEKGESHGD